MARSTQTHYLAQWGPVCLTTVRYVFHFCISFILNAGASDTAFPFLFLGAGARPGLLRVILPSCALDASCK